MPHKNKGKKTEKAFNHMLECYKTELFRMTLDKKKSEKYHKKVNTLLLENPKLSLHNAVTC